jgi:4-amino-4-deoxy-L-arabinose transferase-like glycosyltransferase
VNASAPPARVRRWAPIVAAAALGLGLRLLFGFGYWVDKPLTHDEREYLMLGANVAAGRGFTYDAPPPGVPPEQFGRAPLYPLMIAAVQRAAPAADLLRAVKLTQSVIGAATIVLLAMLAQRAAGDRAGAIAAWAAAVYPPFVWMPAYVLSETLYTALALSGILLLGRWIDGPSHALPAADRWSSGLVCVAGVLAGLAALARPAHLFFLLLAVLWLLWRRRLAWALALAAGAALAIAPWTVRNVREHGRFVLIASEGGITFWTGNHRLSSGEGDMAANPAIKLDNARLRAAHPGLSPEALEPIYYREALSAIAADPLWWLQLMARKVFFLIVPIGQSYRLHSSRYLAASIASYAVVLPLGVLGAVRLARRGRWPRALALLFLSAVLACLIFFPQERFRIPAIDPALLVAAASGIALRRQGAARST